MFRAQSSIEFLMIIATVLVVLGVVFVVSQQETLTLLQINAQSQARNSAQQLAAAAREVYAQGEGARKQVYIELPSTYDPSKSFIANNSIKLRASGTDYVATNEFNMVGSLPGNPGGHWVWVISESNRVRIGASLFVLDKAAINALMFHNSSHTETFTITNIHYEPISLVLTPNWPNSDVTLSLDKTNIDLGVGESSVVTITFFANDISLGFYNGDIDILGNATNVSELQTLPVTLQVLLPPSGSPQLKITPSNWSANMLPGQSVLKSFQVCTSETTAVPYVNFIATPGPAGAWVSDLDPLPAMNPDTCLPKIFNLTVPASATIDVYGGAITGTGGGDAEDTVALYINVTANPDDNDGPLVVNLTQIPKPVFFQEPLTILATCDDSTTGNTQIKSGEIKLDNGAWTLMSAVDKQYNEIVEPVVYTYYNPPFGYHNISVRCTDGGDNVGPTVIHKLKVMKEILFITKDEGAGGPEIDWVNWFLTHSSGENYLWNLDQYHRKKITDHEVDTTLYSSVFMAEDTTGGGGLGTSLVVELNIYTARGGYVNIFDRATTNVPKDMGRSVGTGSKKNQKTIYITDNTHYITSPYPAGALTVYTVNNDIQSVPDFVGTKLAQYDAVDTTNRPLAADGLNVAVWGATRPDRMLPTGHDLTTRVIDYAIITSTMDDYFP